MIIIGGATATGKSSVAIELAKLIDGEIISADSMQIYKGMDVGTAKEVESDVKQHLIDVVYPNEPFTVVDWHNLAVNALRDIDSRGKVPIIVGGTGLYIDSLLYKMDYGGAGVVDETLKTKLKNELALYGAEHMHAMLEEVDPVSAQKTHANNTVRVLRALYVAISTGKPISSQKAELMPIEDFDFYVITRDRNSLRKRIDLRIDKMMQNGLESEVKALLDKGYGFDLQSMQAIGYKEWRNYFYANASLAETAELISKNTKAYAKRQETWFNNKKYDYSQKLATDTLGAKELAEYIKSHAKSINR